MKYLALLVAALMLAIGLYAKQNSPPESPYYQYIEGPGVYQRWDNGSATAEMSFCFEIEPFNESWGTLTKVEFSIYTYPGAPTYYKAIDIDYAAEWTRNDAASSFRHWWRSFEWITVEEFVGIEPSQSITPAFYTTPGWSYLWPETSPYTSPLGPYDGTTDFAGTSGYAGEIHGVTQRDLWWTVNPAWHPYFDSAYSGEGPVVLYYSPRMFDLVTEGGTPLGHWGVDVTDATFHIDLIRVRYTFQ